MKNLKFDHAYKVTKFVNRPKVSRLMPSPDHDELLNTDNAKLLNTDGSTLFNTEE